MVTKTLHIEGMMCEHCQANAQKALNKIEGVSATVDLENKSASCQCADSVTDAMLTKAISDAGYSVTAIN